MPASMDQVRELATHLKHNNSSFNKGTNNAKLLDFYVSKYPHAPTKDEIRAEIGSNPDTPVSRFKDALRACFEKDRSLWIFQKRFFIGPSHSIDVGDLSDVLSPTLRFWFHQCINLPVTTRGANTVSRRSTKTSLTPTSGEPFIVLSEPLFFFCPTLGAYLRFLEVNHDGPLGPEEEKAVASARRHLLHQIQRRHVPNSIHKFFQELELEPVRLYLPAGDSYAKTAIRRWFRTTIQHFAKYKEAFDVPLSDYTKSNLIVLASRSSLPLLARFQDIVPQLKLLLTKTGIRFDHDDLSDEIGADHCTRKARVIVTQWVLDTQNVHTYIASNHTRAVEAVAKLLVDDDSFLLQKISAGLITPKGEIAQRFQVAFEVELRNHETHANDPELLPQLGGRPIIY
jgi:hypothetical protein